MPWFSTPTTLSAPIKTRARSAMFGNGDLLKGAALDIILDATQGAALRQSIVGYPSSASVN